MFPRVIDYMITSTCNLHCPFCYGPDPNSKSELDFEQKIALLKFLRTEGIQGIVIAGGEPLVSLHLLEVVRMSRQLGIQVALQTNAYSVKRLLPLLEMLTWLALPIDGVTEETNSFMRTSGGHLNLVIAVIQKLAPFRANGLRLKIGTVVTPSNINQLPEIAAVIDTIKPDVWKWYQVRPRGAGKINFNSLNISSERILGMAKQVREQYPLLDPVVSLTPDTFGAYLIVNPDSELVIPQYDDYLSFGRIVTREGSVNREVWLNGLRHLDNERHMHNMVRTFPNEFSEGYLKRE